ncbi:MAG TPA: hypothetical protein VGR10_08105 [Thermoleophilaceae bacterium]|nr:hypothetical protein [Thermoleophilaceae bacterium]
MSRTEPECRTLAPLGRRRAPVVENEAVGPYRLIAMLDAGGPAGPRPGQFYMLSTADGWGAGEDERPYLPRAFSFARARPEPEGARLEFLLEAIGPGTERLGAVMPGEEMLLTGPLGVGFAPPPAEGGRPLLVGGGIGVAPVLAWNEELARVTAPTELPGGGRRRIEPRVLLGFRSASYARAAHLFAGQPSVVTDDGSLGRRGLVTALLEEELERAEPPVTVYACGPPPMLESVRAICAERGVPAQLALESGMACGYGACFGCVVPTREGFVRLCVDGPVLDAAVLDTAAPAGTGH